MNPQTAPRRAGLAEGGQDTHPAPGPHRTFEQHMGYARQSRRLEQERFAPLNESETAWLEAARRRSST